MLVFDVLPIGYAPPLDISSKAEPDRWRSPGTTVLLKRYDRRSQVPNSFSSLSSIIIFLLLPGFVVVKSKPLIVYPVVYLMLL